MTLPAPPASTARVFTHGLSFYLRAGLQVKVMKADQKVKQTLEEMKYFKLELLNREENFNKMFNASPNIGVMQVVKPKQGAGPPSGRRATAPGLPPLGSNGQSPTSPQYVSILSVRSDHLAFMCVCALASDTGHLDPPTLPQAACK